MKHKAILWSNVVLLDKKNAPVPVAEPEPYVDAISMLTMALTNSGLYSGELK
jgi:hypothetical protein